MQTYPCGHRVVCRLCFVKTIQTAVAQRVLPLRCVVCRTKILKLKQTSPAPAPAPAPSVTAAWSRGGVNQVRSTRHAASGTCSNGGIAAALSPRHSVGGGSKLMQPLPIYPAVNGGGASTGGRGATSGSSGSCHHHHLPLHHQAVQRRAMTAWTSSASPPTSTTPTSLTVSASLAARPGASGAVFNSAVAGTGRCTASRRSTSSSAASHAGSPRITAAGGRVPAAGHDTKRIQRLK